MVSELTYTLENIVVANKSSRHSSFMVDGFRKNDHTHGLEFFFNGSLVAAIDTEWYVIDLKNLKAQEKKDEDENKYV